MLNKSYSNWYLIENLWAYFFYKENKWVDEKGKSQKKSNTGSKNATFLLSFNKYRKLS